MSKLNKSFWEDRYLNRQTGWDIGYTSTPIKNYIDQLPNKDLKILIPGAGNSYEAEYLWKKGFKNVYVLDIVQQPLLNFQKRIPEFPESNLIHDDFFKINETFDLIIEHTFFCSLDPELRYKYALKVSQLLKPKGKLVGLLFDCEFLQPGPPFGGSRPEYLKIFAEFFDIKTMETSYNSIKPRRDRELFFIFDKI